LRGSAGCAGAPLTDLRRQAVRSERGATVVALVTVVAVESSGFRGAEMSEPSETRPPNACRTCGADIPPPKGKAVAGRLMLEGWHVYRCLSPNGPFDLIAFREGVTRRIEVRTGHYSEYGRLVYSDDRDAYVTEFGVWIADGNLVEFEECGPVECVKLAAREKRDAEVAELIRQATEKAIEGVTTPVIEAHSKEVAEQNAVIRWQRSEMARLLRSVKSLETKLARLQTKRAAARKANTHSRSTLSPKHRELLACKKAERERIKAEIRATELLSQGDD
jgi:hypothetical protein